MRDVISILDTYVEWKSEALVRCHAPFEKRGCNPYRRHAYDADAERPQLVVYSVVGKCLPCSPVSVHKKRTALL